MANPTPAVGIPRAHLADFLAKGVSGRLSVGKGAAQVSIFVRKGALLAAASADDTRLTLRRLGVRGALPVDRTAELQAMNDLGEPVFGPLFDEVDPAALEAVLQDRFTDNLVRFLVVGVDSKPRFKPMDVIFVENVQLPPAPAEVVDQAAEIASRAIRVRADGVISAGKKKPGTPAGHAMRALLTGPTAAADLLAEADVEPFLGRAVLAELVEAGVLVLQQSEGVEVSEAPPDAEPVEAAALAAPEPDDESEVVGPTEEEAAATALAGLTSLDAWIGSTELVDEDELDAFADNEHDRGAGSEGARVETQALEKFDVAEGADEPDPDDDEPEEVAADEAQNTYSAPTLSEEDAAAKVVIANTDLAIIAASLDAVSGAGAGRAALQLLIEGPPARFLPLFRKLQLSDKGELPGDDLLDNLYTRPASEHRAMLSDGLIDLIERSLSAVGDELPDEAFDKMYEAVAGYRQKLIG